MLEWCSLCINVCNIRMFFCILLDVSRACLKLLEVSINFDTVFTILSLADLYLCKELQDGAKFFILQNLDDIVMSEECQLLKLIGSSASLVNSDICVSIMNNIL